jgi:hypothetical protein
MGKKYSLDIFKVLANLNSPRSGDVYAKLSDDEKKGFAPLVIMRWMSGTSDARQILALNTFVNPVVFPLAKHPHLLSLLLQVSSSKTNGRCSWLGIKSKKKNVEALKVVGEYLEMSDRELKMLNPFPTENEVMQMAEELGWQKEELAKLKKEYQS